MKILFTLTTLLIFQLSFAQTWSDDVAQIVYNKCAQCHHTGGVGGFSLLTYTEANAYSSLLEAPITNEEMPPWPPESGYQSYTHDRSLTAAEKTTFLGWITNMEHQRGIQQTLLRHLFLHLAQFWEMVI